MPTTTPTAAHPAQQQPRVPNHNSAEATKRIAPEPLPADDPEVTGAGPVVDDTPPADAPGKKSDKKVDEKAEKKADTVDMNADDDGADTAPDGEQVGDDDNGGIGRDNKGVPP